MNPAIFRFTVGIFVLSLGSGPSALAADGTAYTPSLQPEKSEDALRRELEAALKRVGRFVQLKVMGKYVVIHDALSSLSVNNNGVSLEFADALAPAAAPPLGSSVFTYRFDYEELADMRFDAQICQPDKVSLPLNLDVRLPDKTGYGLCDTLYNLQKRHEAQTQKERADFEGLAASYRNQTIKPVISEELRKLIVQAELLRERKDYAGAAERYRKVLRLDPVAYPAGYFNLALLYEQEQQYGPAIVAMQKYLLLMPNASDARAAQDKIYGWEMLAERK